MNAKEELTALLTAHIPLIHVVTYEEQRVLGTLSEIREARDLGIVTWDAPEGFIEHRVGKQPFPPKETDFRQASQICRRADASRHDPCAQGLSSRLASPNGVTSPADCETWRPGFASRAATL